MTERIRVGELDQKVEFFFEEEGFDDEGRPIDERVIRHKCWAHVRPMSGRERTHAHQRDTSATYRVWIRNSAKAREVQDSDKIAWRGTDMRIEWIGHHPRAEFIEIEAEAGVAT